MPPNRETTPIIRKRPRGRPDDAVLAARRRGQILDVATPLFAKRGFPNTDLQVVADELRVGKGTIYRYFKSKEDLFLAAVDRGMKRLRERIDAEVAGAIDPLEQIERAIRSYLAFFDASPEIVELLIQERAEFKDRKKPTYFEHRDANIGRWLDLLRGLVAAGRVRKAPVEEFTETISDLLYGTIFTNHFAGRREPMEAQARRILNTLLLGILADGERDLYASARRRK